jgi:hypothetical protein
VLLGKAMLPGTASDLSGLKDVLKDGTPHNRLGALGSAIAWTGQGNRYVLVADRGPQDGAVAYFCRFHVFDVVVEPGGSPTVKPTIVATKLLTNEAGKNLVGLSTAFDPTNSPASPRFDPEGVRVGRDGNLFISEEYGPWVCEFDRRNGRRLRTFDIPKKFLIAKPSGDGKKELPPHNTSGRVSNRGFESLAISPDGSKLYALLQSPLIQDGGVGRKGVNVRLLEIPVKDGKMRELVYQMDSGQYGINEILAINDHEFLVLERDHLEGKKAKFKRLFKIDVTGATDVSKVESLPETGLPEGVKPVAKKLFLDLLDPALGVAGPELPAKLEGLAFGPDLPDGRRLLLMTTDNDFIATEPTVIFAFAVDAADLPGFQPQVFDKR